MSNQLINHPDHDEIVSMLPWFVNNTLEGEHRKRVIDHIGQCDECQREVHFLRDLNETVNNDANSQNELRADVDKSLAHVMDRIESDSQKDRAVSSASSWLQDKLAGIFNFSTELSFAQWGATAMAGLLVAVLGFQMFSGQSEENYTVLSSPDANNASIRLSVEMSAEGNQEQLRTLIQQKLEQLGQPIEMESGENGVYIIVLKDTIDVAGMSALVTQLESETQVERVEILP